MSVLDMATEWSKYMVWCKAAPSGQQWYAQGEPAGDGPEVNKEHGMEVHTTAGKDIILGQQNGKFQSAIMTVRKR
jgi:hypothetical protein